MLLDEMEIFYYVVEFNSFSKAATRLKVSKSFISKKIFKLEHDLQVSLVSRSTRKLTITEAGQNFYHYCAKVVRDGQDAYSMMGELHGKPSGRLKISMPPALGLNLVSPVISKYCMQYPDVSLDIGLENRMVDVLTEGYDLVLRSGTLESSNLIAQRVYSGKNIICASENYLKTHDQINLPADLERHRFAVYNLYSRQANHITFLKNKHEETIHVKSSFVANHLDLIKKMVCDDVCVAMLPYFMVVNELKSGKIQACLSRYQLPETPLYAVYPERSFMLPKLKCFLDLLKEHLSENERDAENNH